MSKLTDQLSDLGIHNGYNFAGNGNPYIAFNAARTGLASRSANYCVIRPGYQTDPDAHWRDNGCKTFACFGGTKAEKLEEAKAWAGARYKITEWAKTPFGTWMDATFVKARLAELKSQLSGKS